MYLVGCMGLVFDCGYCYSGLILFMVRWFWLYVYVLTCADYFVVGVDLVVLCCC